MRVKEKLRKQDDERYWSGKLRGRETNIHNVLFLNPELIL